MSQRELDEAIAAMRDAQPEEKVVRDAAGRVFKLLFKTTFLPDSVDRIRGCADFQALIPAYLDRTLAPSRALLVRDHTLECVACRRVLQEAQGREPEVINRPMPRLGAFNPIKRMPVMAWAIAATLLVGIAAGFIAARLRVLPGQNRLEATVSSVEGTLYRVSDAGSVLIKDGALIRNADQIRTASGSRAILRLVGGALLELGERSEVSVSRGWEGTTVNLEQGRLIVDSLQNPAGNLYVSSSGVVVPIKNAVLSVDRGTKGARVALAKGSAQVQEGQNRISLTAGKQTATNGLQDVPIASEFAWSQNADSYLALLSELSTLQKQFENIPSPRLRYSSNLAKYVPENAVLYAAIPNLGGTITEAKRIFDERLAESEVLRDWWKQRTASHTEDFDRLIDQISTISNYLGDEIVLCVTQSAGGSYGEPVLLAEIRSAGLAEYLQQNLPATADVTVLSNGSDVPKGKTGALLVSTTNNVLVATTGSVELNQIDSLIRNPAAQGFTSTPFYSRIAQSYTGGAGYFFAVDLEQIIGKPVQISKEQGLSGVNNAQYLVLERRVTGSVTDNRASLSFSSARQGVASWLGAPGPMGSLDFVSPDASAAVCFVMKSPRRVIEELIAFATQNDASLSRSLNEFELHAGVNLVDDVAAPFGNDVTFAVDGPLLPIPSWRLVVEVNDPARLQQTIATLLDRFNQDAPENDGKLHAGSEQINSRTFYWLRSDKAPGVTAYYTFVDGYLLASTSEANLTQAIKNRDADYTLASSANFRSQLPVDGYTDSSGVIYVNAGGSSLGLLGQQLKGSGNLNTGQQKALSTLLANSGPGLICVYGEPDRIVAASRGSFLGFNLGTLVGVEQGRPLFPLLAANFHSRTPDLEKQAPQQRR